MKFMVPILAALALTGCALFDSPATPETDVSAPNPAYKRVEVADQIATPAERAACDAVGGEISRQGLLGWEQCVQTYPDAGKICRDEADCEGTCRADPGNRNIAPGEPATGTCQTVDVPFGCYAMIEDGKMGYPICVD